MEEQTEIKTDVMAIPKWFTWLVSGFIALCVPWASWVTMSLATISVRIEQQSEIRDRVAAIEKEFARHLTERGIHHHFANDIDSIRDRIIRLENNNE